MSAKSRKEKILDAMEYLESKDYAIMESLYGFNGKTKYSVKSVKKYFKVSDAYLDVLKERVNEIIVDYFSDEKYEDDEKKYGYFNVEKVDAEKQKLIDKMSTVFFDMFPEANPLAVEKSLRILPKKTQNIIFLFYGLDGVHCLDYDEIAEELKITVDEVDEAIEKGIFKLKKHFKNSVNNETTGYSKDNKYGNLISIYGKENLEETLLLLPELSQKLIEDFSCVASGVTYRELGEKYGVDATATRNRIYNGLNRVDKVLSDKGNHAFLDEFYNRYRGHSAEDVHFIMEKLDDEKRKMLIDFIGVDKKRKNIRQISETYNVNEEKVKEILKTSMLFIEEEIKKVKKSYKNKVKREAIKINNPIVELVRVYSIANVMGEIKKLDTESQGLMRLVANQSDNFSYSEIAKKYGVDVGEIYKRIKYYVKKIEKELRKNDKNVNLKTKRGRKSEDLTISFDNLIIKYGLKNFNLALSKLRKETQELISLYLGLNGEKLSTKELSDKFSVNENSLKIRIKNNAKSMQKTLENPQLFEEKNKTEDNKKNGRIFSEKYNVLIQKYGLEKVENAISMLSSRNQDIFKMCIGIGCESLTNEDIASKYHLSVSYISNLITILFKKIEKNITNPQSTKSTKYQELIEKYGIETVNEALNLLKKEYRETLELLFGINGEPLSKTQIAKKLGLATNSIFNRVNKGVDNLIKIIENPQSVYQKKNSRKSKREDKYRQLIENYGEEKVKHALLQLNEKQQGILKDYYGIDCSRLTVVQMQEKYGMNYRSVYFNVKSGINNIFNRINNIKKGKKSGKAKENKYRQLVEKYGEETVKVAFAKLKEKQQIVLKNYYGIDCGELTTREIKEKYGIGNSSIQLSLKNGIEKIIEYIENPNVKDDKTSRMGKKKINKYQVLTQKYGEDIVKENFIHIDEKNREIIKLYYGINCEEMSTKEIEEKFKIKRNAILLRVKKSIEKLENIIVNGVPIKKEKKVVEKTRKNRINKYQQLVDKYGKEKVEEAFNKMKENAQIVLKCYYGINQEIEGQKQINTKYGIPMSTIGYLINKGIENIENLIINPDIEEKSKKVKNDCGNRQNKYLMLVEKYGKEKVEQAFSRLSEKVQLIIKDYYGLNGEFLKVKQIHDKYDFPLSTIHYSINKGLNDIEFMIEHPNHIIEKKAKVKEKDYRYQDLIDKYGKETVEKELLKLSEKHQLILKEFYINGVEQKEIAKKLDLSPSSVSYTIAKCIKGIERNILNPIEVVKKEEFYSKFEGYTEEQVNYSLSKIGDTYKHILELSFGLNGVLLNNNEISLKTDIPLESVNHFKYIAIKKVKEKLLNIENDKLNDSRKGVNFKALIEKYGEDLVKECVGKLIVSDRGFLGMYYTFANNKKYTLSELSLKIGMDENKLADHELLIISRLEAILKIRYKEEYLKKMREEFAKETKSNQFYLKQALQSLKKEELRLIGLYYGINGKDIMRVEELSKTFNTSEEKIEKAVKKIISKVRHYIPSGKR